MNEYNNNDNNNTSGGTGTQSPYYSAPDPAPGYHYGQEPAHAKKKGLSAGAVVAICLVCAILAAAAGVGVTYFLLQGRTGGEAAEVTEVTPEPLPSAEAEEPSTEEPAGTDGLEEAALPAAETEAPGPDVGRGIYEQATKQVVGVTTEITYTNYFGQISAASVSGTGFIISEDGYILTNNHVIEDAREGGYDVSVLMYDGTEYTAEIVGYDTENDIAVLKIDADDLTPVTMGDASDIVVGDTIYAVGNPLGELNYTMTTGIISATDRAITTDTDSVPINMFQIDAAVNSGNSGGPVYDASGEVIGVVTAKTSATGVEGLGFAIPIEDAKHIADQLMEYGYVTDRATVGISGYTLPDSVADRYGMVPGAYVTSVVEGGPADEAGIQERDIITAVDGQEVAGFTELTTIVRDYDVGDTAELTIWRNGETVTVSLTFGESQKPVEPTPSPEPERNQPNQDPYNFGGDMDDFFRQFFGFGF